MSNAFKIPEKSSILGKIIETKIYKMGFKRNMYEICLKGSSTTPAPTFLCSQHRSLSTQSQQENLAQDFAE